VSVVIAGLVQRRRAAKILGVDVSSNTQEPFNLWQVVQRSRLDQLFVNVIHSFFRLWRTSREAGRDDFEDS
jgi:hypothetical protein